MSSFAFAERPSLPDLSELRSRTAELHSARAALDVAPPSRKAALLAALTQKAAARQQALLQAIEEDPASVLAVALPASERLSFPEEVRSFLEHEVTVEGTALLQVRDYTDRPGRDFLVLMGADGRFFYSLHFNGGERGIPRDRVDQHLQIQGLQVGHSDIAVTHLTLLPRSAVFRNGGTRPTLLSRVFKKVLDWADEKAWAYNLSGTSWANGNMSASFVPDEALWGNVSVNTLFSRLDGIAQPATWQREFARALQSWANVAPLNFRFTPDNGSPMGIAGLAQGDTRFGDGRLGAAPIGSLAHASYPSNFTSGGDITIDTESPWHIGSDYDLYSVLLHESGHALGLGHSSLFSAVMYPVINGVYTGLNSDDVAGIQAIYGPRPPDAYDAQASNNTPASAKALDLSSGSLSISADITNTRDSDFNLVAVDRDYYRIVAPAASNGTLRVSADPTNLSLFSPKISALDSNQVLLGSASAEDYGRLASVSVSGLSSGAVLYILVEGATNDVFGMGAYRLNLQMSPPAVTVPAAPGTLSAAVASPTQISLTWVDNSGNETAFLVQRSTDGIGFADLALLPANSTSYTDLNAQVGQATLFTYRVSTLNSAGVSAFSAASVTMVPPPPPAAPSDLVAQAVSYNSIHLSWTDNSTDENGFRVENSFNGVNFNIVGNVGANIVSYDAPCNANTTYYYRVCATKTYANTVLSDYSNVAGATTPVIPTDTQAPVVSLTAPANGALLKGTLAVNATASDNLGVTRVEFYVDGVLKANDTTSPYTYSWDTTLGATGSHTLLAKAYDAAGNIGTSSTVTVTVDNTPPTVAITSPANGSTIPRSGSLGIQVSATDNVGVTTVEIRIDGALKATLTSTPYTTTWNAKKAAKGAHSIQATAQDAAGNKATAGVTVNK